ncbi:small heat shock protein hspG3 [Drosophila virilis]|uniref:Uncharacterized protein n=1 Tax=Drosophila virilis TaxID=7244 RepID=B4M4M4_DROVI|nr:putative uncharacterized protein DDB_G0282129 [Drosophila virilis]EDW59585.2 uncharacterized protein Dvir_GJ10968 [Drosophila virilis]
MAIGKEVISHTSLRSTATTTIIMFWTAVASSTVTPTGMEQSPGMASAAPTYQRHHTKPPRVVASSWQISNAAFRARRYEQQQQQLQAQERLEQQQQQQQQEQEKQQQQDSEIESAEPKQKSTNNKIKKVSPKSENKIIKALTSCKCTQKDTN